MQAAARAVVFARDGSRCQFPHGAMGVECAGRLELCHVIPRGLCSAAQRWDPDNLFVGCAAGNAWCEDHTAEAFATARHGHPWDTVAGGRVVA